MLGNAFDGWRKRQSQLGMDLMAEGFIANDQGCCASGQRKQTR